MNVRYQHSFLSPAGESWQIQILDANYSGAAVEFDCYAPGFTYNLEGEGDERTDFIKMASVKVHAIVESTAFETFINDVVGALEQRFFIKILHDDEPWFVGVMVQDLITIPLAAFPYSFEMTFTDGIGMLKELNYDNAGTLYVGRDTFKWHVLTLLAKTGINQLFTGTDVFLTTQINWYSTVHSTAATNCPLAYTDVDHRAFQKVDESDYSYTSLKCIDVLDVICKTFGARFYQANGRYYFTSLTIDPQYVVTRNFGSAGNYMSSASVNMSKAVSLLKVREGSEAQLTFLPPLLNITNTHTHRMSVNVNNLLTAAYAYPYQYLCNVEEVPGSANSRDYFKFTGRFEYSGWATNMSSLTIRAVVGFTVKIVRATGTIRYLANATPFSVNAVWSSTNPNYYKVALPINTASPNFNQSLSLAWDSPEFPYDGEVYWEVSLLYYERLVGYSWQYYAPPAIPAFSFGFACYEFKLIIKMLEYPYSLISGGKSQFTITQVLSGTATPVKASTVIDLEEIPVSDGPFEYSVGKLKASVDGINFNNTTFWSRNGGSTTYRLYELRLQELISGQLTPVRVLNMSWYQEDWHPGLIYLIDSKYYMFNGGSYSPDDCTVRGEWFELRNTVNEAILQFTAKTLETDVIPNPSLPSGSSTDGGSLSQNSDVIANLFRGLVARDSVTYLTTGLTAGTAVTSLACNRIASATLRSGDTIMVADTITGSVESFTVSADQAADAETIAVSSLTPSVDIPEGAVVLIASSEVKRYFNDVPRIIRTTSDPAASPAASGNIYINTATGTIWVANGTASTSNWIQVNNFD